MLNGTSPSTSPICVGDSRPNVVTARLESMIRRCKQHDAKPVLFVLLKFYTNLIPRQVLAVLGTLICADLLILPNSQELTIQLL